MIMWEGHYRSSLCIEERKTARETSKWMVCVDLCLIVYLTNSLITLEWIFKVIRRMPTGNNTKIFFTSFFLSSQMLLLLLYILCNIIITFFFSFFSFWSFPLNVRLLTSLACTSVCIFTLQTNAAALVELVRRKKPTRKKNNFLGSWQNAYVLNFEVVYTYCRDNRYKLVVRCSYCPSASVRPTTHSWLNIKQERSN